jgi:hypothetical protein
MRTILGILSLTLALGIPATVGAASGPASVVPATRVVVFHPGGATGTRIKGNCWTESIALDRADAWRCMAGNAIYDPCFSASPHAMTVICNADPTHPEGVTMRLTSALPTHSPARDIRPWSMMLGDGTYCSAVTGATGIYAGQPMTFYCTNQRSVLGEVYLQGKVWYATILVDNKSYQPIGVFAISVKTLYR